jgi:hypothetical protein
MIGRLEGRLHRVDPGTVVIDVGGVGYLVSTTLRAFQALAGRADAALWIHTQVRDDAIVLFGFPDREELEAFSKLIAVAGVGPRTALAVLSALTADELCRGLRELAERPPSDSCSNSKIVSPPLLRVWMTDAAMPSRHWSISATPSATRSRRSTPFGPKLPMVTSESSSVSH